MAEYLDNLFIICVGLGVFLTFLSGALTVAEFFLEEKEDD